MSDASFVSSRQVGYCTNVHAGTDLHSIRENLSTYATAVRDELAAAGRGETLGVGLWIPDQASRQLSGESLQSFADFLKSNRLAAFTINGFPYANFHGDHVKQRVYLPTWAAVDRLEYTKRLATILTALLPDDLTLGSISTLPIGWPSNPYADAADSTGSFELAGQHFRELAAFLAQLESQTGKRIVVAIEPEPGCLLDTVDDVVVFFDQQLPEEMHRKYLTVCHDICHSAVMNESQRSAIQSYRDSGITIGKVQVSSAIVADWSAISPSERGATLEQLKDFAEDRYLHQTGQVSREGVFELVTDLPDVLDGVTEQSLDAVLRWVIHFHVPIFLERFGHLTTSRDDVVQCLQALGEIGDDVGFTGHFEAETYAWTVLPEEMRRRGLAGDIAGELQWLMKQLELL